MADFVERRQGLGGKIRSTLGTRLSIALILMIVISAVSMLFISQYLMRVYHEELTQKLNANIAMYVNDEYQLISDDSFEVNLKAIEHLSQQAMIINPIAEVYLLDTQGKVIAHALPDVDTVTESIALDEIKRFIANPSDLPIRGPDPRNPTESKIFSATELHVSGQLKGYLYVVLESEIYTAVGDVLAKSYSGTLAMVSTSVIILMAIMAGLLIFSLLLARLKKLTAQICEFSHQHATESGRDVCDDAAKSPQPKDEIFLLTSAFEQMSDQINRQFTLITEADNARRELISNVSHDLRTPLASMKGFLETLLIKNEQLDIHAREAYLKTALSSANRLSKLISELFELSKLDSPSTVLNSEKFSLTELVYDTVQKFELEFAQKQISWEVDSRDMNFHVYADISLIQRVFENLVKNALAYTPENGSVRFELSAPDHHITRALNIRIIDTGYGISKADLPYIFERFYTNPDLSRETEGSTGLGLAIVKRIIDLHGSVINVDSQLNHGTTFEFKLPLAA